jgi:type II secretory pathway component PulJ
MTLIEILMGIVLSGIVLAALVGGIMAYMRGADAMTNLLNETPELQLVATTFGTDVQSAETVTVPSGAPTCLPPAVTATKIVDFEWHDHLTTTDTGTVVDVSYAYSDATHQLSRFVCRNHVFSDQTNLLTHVQPDAVNVAQKPAATCDLGACSNPQPRRVDLTVYVCTADRTGAACADPAIPAQYTGVRRLP